MATSILYCVSHPIQYQAPLLRRIAQEKDISLRVVFDTDFSTKAYADPGFGVTVKWDVPLRDGYDRCLRNEIDLDGALAAADILWLHGWERHWLRRLIGKAHRTGKPVLIRGENWFGAMPENSGILPLLKKQYRLKLLQKCSAALAIGSRNKEYYLAYGFQADAVFDMPYAVDNDFFQKNSGVAEVAEVRRRHGLAAGRPIILFAGKLIPRKRPADLLEAWNAAQWSGGERPALVIVGDGELGENLRRDWRSEDILFAGFKNQSELPAYYAAADLFVMPSEKEPWGLAANEAMACGTAVVATDQCGAAFDLIDADCGAIYPMGNVDALAGILPPLLEVSGRLGGNARTKIRQFDFDADIRGLRAAMEYVL